MGQNGNLAYMLRDCRMEIYVSGPRIEGGNQQDQLGDQGAGATIAPGAR